ncbi:MAG: alpha/beta hydrolase, partial [Mesorhizobium sp.]
DPSDWRISPLYGDLSVLPKTLLLTGSRDMLTPDNLIFAQKARAAGVAIEVVHEQGMFHAWPLIDMPEARRARDSIVTFLASDTESYHAKAGELALQRTGREVPTHNLSTPSTS